MHLMVIMEMYAKSNIFDVRMARVYDDALKVAVRHEDTARALAFAQRGFSLYLAREGDDAEKTRSMKEVLDDPTKHEWWGARKGDA